MRLLELVVCEAVRPSPYACPLDTDILVVVITFLVPRYGMNL